MQAALQMLGIDVIIFNDENVHRWSMAAHLISHGGMTRSQHDLLERAWQGGAG
jgi:hypothetical protein